MIGLLAPDGGGKGPDFDAKRLCGRDGRPRIIHEIGATGEGRPIPAVPRADGMKRVSGLAVCAVAALLVNGCGQPRTADSGAAASSAASDSDSDPGLSQRPQKESASDFQMSDAVVLLDEESFERRVVMSDKPVLVDFSATWCRPCRLMEPALDSVAREYQGRAVVGKVDVDQSERLAERYQIRAIPCILVFQNGRVVDQTRGLQSREALSELLNRQIAGQTGAAEAVATSRSSSGTETATTELLAPSPDEETTPSSAPVLPTPPEPPAGPEATAKRIPK